MENINNQVQVKPTNNLGYAMAAYILFSPFGIPALIYAIRVNKLWYSGRHAEAEHASKSAMKWCKISLIGGIVSIALLIIFMVVYFSAIIAIIAMDL